MGEELVTLTNYRFAAKAEVAKWALEQEGIQAFLADDNLVTMDWFLGNAVGYVKLQVPRSQVEAATRVLEANPQLLDSKRPDADNEEDVNECLSCGAPMREGDTTCPKCGWSYGANENET
jgi:hypothetical protein